MATCRMSNTLFETIRILFFLPFLDASYEGYVFRLRMQIQMYVKSVEKIFADWKEEKKKRIDNATIENREFFERYKRNFFDGMSF